MFLSSAFLRRPQKFCRLLSKFQNHKDDCADFCGLLRISELYPLANNQESERNIVDNDFVTMTLS